MSVGELAATPPRRGRRWLLFGSLALNLFFIGIAVAFAVRSPPWDRNVLVRIEWVASTLPTADAAILRDAVKVKQDAIETSQKKYRDARDHIRDILRQQPFSEPDLRAAMTASRAARQNYDEVLHGMFADAAAKMSAEGRRAMANWRKRRRSRK
jgi:uncharacterized membrane protein